MRSAHSARIVNYVGFAPIDSPYTYFSEATCPKDIDFISIDTDDCDHNVWDLIAANRQRVDLIEFNPAVPNDCLFVQERDMTINKSSSLLAITDLAKSKGYELACALDSDALFSPAELFPKLGIETNSTDAMVYAPRREMRIFPTFDGTLYVTGRRQIDWGVNKNVTFGPEDLQVVPPERRRFRRHSARFDRPHQLVMARAAGRRRHAAVTRIRPVAGGRRAASPAANSSSCDPATGRGIDWRSPRPRARSTACQAGTPPPGEQEPSSERCPDES